MIAFFDGMVRAFLKSVIDHIYFINVYREIPCRFASDLVHFRMLFRECFGLPFWGPIWRHQFFSRDRYHPSSDFFRNYFRIFSITSQQESFVRLEVSDGKSFRALGAASRGCSTGLALRVGCKDDALSRHMRSITCTPISDARKYLSASWVNAACFRLLRNSENASTMTGSYVFSLIVNWGMASSISAGKR